MEPGVTEADIPFSADFSNINTSQRDALLGSSDGTLVKWYNQGSFGSSVDMAQASGSIQPFAKSTSVITINGKQAFKGVKTSNLRIVTPSTNWGIGTGDFFISLIIRHNTVENWSALFGFGNNAPSANARQGGTSNFGILAPGNHVFTGTSSINTDYVVSFARESGTLKLWINGIQDATTFAGNALNFGTSVFSLFTDATASFDSGSNSIQECLLYASAMVTDRAVIMANQKTFAGL